MRALGSLAAGLVAALGLLFSALDVAADGPRVFVYPNPVTDGQQAVVYGQNFCGASGCSDVTVSVDGRIVATGVKVKSDGSFAASFAVTQLFGQHTVLASQTDAGGSTISASGGFRVAAGDVSSPTPQPTHTPPSQPPHSPPASVGASPTPSRTTPVAQTPPSPQSVQSATSSSQATGAGWIAWIGIALLVVLLVAGIAIVLARRLGR